MPEGSAEVRVRVGDTDMFGVVYFANYLKLFEVGIDALLTSLKPGLDARKELWDRRFLTPIVEAYCRYKAPARYGDVLTIKARVDEIGEDYVKYAISIERKSDEKVCATGYVKAVIVDKSGWKRVRCRNSLGGS